MSEEGMGSAFRPVPRTGVIYVTTEAQQRGFRAGDPAWCNLGQGQPETGPLPGAPRARPRASRIDVDDQEYAPVAGIWELREAIAGLYNRLYRRGHAVAVQRRERQRLGRRARGAHPRGGQPRPRQPRPLPARLHRLRRAARHLQAFTAIPILLEGERGYAFSVDDLRREVLGRGLAALLLSNPCNPTGKLIRGDELARWVDVARELDCALLLDEFYSHYVWAPASGAGELPVESAARYVEDVDRDPVVIFDGLTKNWRYPGWRVTWTVGPKRVIEAVASAGSFLDGGGSQAAAARGDPAARGRARRSPRPTRSTPRSAASATGCSPASRASASTPTRAPDGTFYVWGKVGALPPPLDDGMGFFRAALDKQVIVVPGEFFDVNPGKRRSQRASRFRRHVRFSFGPALDKLETALGRLETLLAKR